MRVLVTGGAGYIGSIFTRELLNKGYNVTVMDTMFFGEEPLAEISDQIQILKKDIRNTTLKDFEKVDAVVDFAALSNDPSGELDNKLTYSINQEGRTRVAKLAKEAGVKRYVAPSSCAIYGSTNELANELSPVNPLTAYSKANYAWENAILPLADNKYCVVILRQATVYGLSPKIRFDLLVNNFVQQVFLTQKIRIKGDGKEARPFIHIKDDCNAIISALEAESDLINKQIFNVGSNDQNVKVRQLIDLVEELLNIKISKEFGEWVDKRNYIVSFDKIAKVLKFKRQYNIKYGIKEIYDALNNGSLDPYTPTSITVEWYKKLIAEGDLKLI